MNIAGRRCHHGVEHGGVCDETPDHLTHLARGYRCADESLSVRRLRETVTTRGPKRTVVTCPTCGSKRIIGLTVDQAEVAPPDERPAVKCVRCGERIFSRPLSRPG